MDIRNVIAKIRTVVVITSAVFVLVACGEVIDGSNPANFDSSTAKMMQSMSREEMQDFKSNLKKASSYIAYETSKNNQGGNFVAAMMAPGAYNANIIEHMHKKSASDIKKLAEKWDTLVRDQQERQNKESRENTIKNLKEIIDASYSEVLAYEKTRKAFEKIKIENVRISIQHIDTRHHSELPILVSGTVVNNSEVSISQINFYVSGIFRDGYRNDRAIVQLQFRDNPISPGTRSDFKEGTEWVTGYLKNPEETNNYLASSSFPLSSITADFEVKAGRKSHYVSGDQNKLRLEYGNESSREQFQTSNEILKMNITELQKLGENYKSPNEQAYLDFMSTNKDNKAQQMQNQQKKQQDEDERFRRNGEMLKRIPEYDSSKEVGS